MSYVAGDACLPPTIGDRRCGAGRRLLVRRSVFVSEALQSVAFLFPYVSWSHLED